MPKTKKTKQKAIVNHLSFSSFIHETENKEKLVRGILNFIPEERRENFKEKFIFNHLEGVFHNKITMLSLKITSKDVLIIFDYLYKKFIPLNFLEFSQIFDEEKQILHLRIHKLQIFNDSLLSLSKGQDIIKIMIKFQCFPKCTKEYVYSYLEKEYKDD